MKCLLLVPLGLLLIPTSAAFAQVKIDIPGQRFRRQEEIRTKVINIGKQPITLCLTFTSMGSLPLPFAAQLNNGGKWGTLLLGSDLGPNGSVLVLEAGESQEFPFHLSDSGKMRLMLEYCQGAKPNLTCNALPKGSKVVTSAVFTIPDDISVQTPSAPVPFCEMVLHPKNYDGKVVFTVALALSSYHSLAFYDPTCKPTEENNVTTQMVLPNSFTSNSLGKKLSKALRREHTANVSVQGKFYGTGGPFGPDVANFCFVVERIDSVAEVFKSAR